MDTTDTTESFSRSEVCNMLSDLSHRLQHDEVALEEIDNVAREYGVLDPADVDVDDDDQDVDDDE